MTAIALARRIVPVPPDMTCAEVYERMAEDETLFAVPIVASEIPLGLIDRIALMSQFARPYWREVYSHRPITKLMDKAPVIVDVKATIETIGLRIASHQRTTLNAAFIFISNDLYYGVGSTVDLLQRMVDAAHFRTQELGFAHAEIQALNESLERRVADRTQELEAAQKEIVRKERLSALGQLTATVAHEIRNPLSSIRNTIFAIKEALRGSTLDLERPMSRIERSIERCDHIISDLLDYTRAQDLRRRTVTLETWLDEVLAEIPIPDTIVLARDFGTRDCRIAIDAERMRRVVINLVENAVQAMAEIPGPHRITLTTRALEAGFELAIADTGPGIPSDVLPKVFEPLFSTKSFGTGLGLPTVKQIVEQHGGSITIASGAGKGTSVIVRMLQAGVKDIAA